MSRRSDRCARYFFWASVALVMFGYGYAARSYQIFPYSLLMQAKRGYLKLATTTKVTPNDYCIERTKGHRKMVSCVTGQRSSGLTVLTHINDKRMPAVDVIDMDGNTHHHWTIDWFTLWPDAKHVPPELVPKARPGTHIHGALLMPNGDLVFNFEFLGLVRLDTNGKVLWRLPYQTHHALSQASDGNLWVCGRKSHKKPCKRIPNWCPPFSEDMLLEVTPEGKIAHEWSVVDLLQKNGLEGLLYLSTREGSSTKTTCDPLHLNDVEPFPDSMQEGFFTQGDVMVSLRNINTIFVFNRATDKIKLVCTGKFVHQHDPDFIDGDTFSVFDNYTIRDDESPSHSRILIVKAPENTVTTYFQGTPANPFYTRIMGKHQWLPNGHLLITEACKGRVFEIDRNKNIVWEYNNFVDENHVGIVEQAIRIPMSYVSLFQNKNSDHGNIRTTRSTNHDADHRN